jgi:hypothetical protein
VACHLHYDHDTYVERGEVVPLERGDADVHAGDAEGVGTPVEASGEEPPGE